MAKVRLEQLRKTFGHGDVIAELNVTVEDRELFMIVGPSGCGKSTLLHMIAGLESPTEGRIVFDDQEVTAMPPRERDVGLVFQNYALYPHMTVADNLAFPLRVSRRHTAAGRTGIETDVRRVAARLGIEELLHRRPRELSGGQQQRVALGRAIIRNPRVLLLDEPLSNLDPPLRAAMRAELRRLHDEVGLTMIYVTHDQAEAMTVADRVAVLERGRLRQVGAPRELYEKPANGFVAGFIGYPPMNLLKAHITQGCAVAGSIRVPLSPAVGTPAEKAWVTVGLRPEEVDVAECPAAGGPHRPGRDQMTGLIRQSEHAEGRTWVTVEFKGAGGPVTLVGLADRGFRGRPGDSATVSLARVLPHCFDLGTGERMAAGEDRRA